MLSITSKPLSNMTKDKRDDIESLDPKDHRVIGQKLDLFTFSDTVGKGLPLWTAKGATVRRELERFIVDEEIAWGYQHVYTPDIAKIDLYKKSGHYPYYKDSMYSPIKVDDEEFMLRPMTCPHHFELFLRRPHSYRELPLRIAELAKLYRYELSGVLTGLIRVRSFCLADAHIICADKGQAKSEVSLALDLIEHITKTLGLKMGDHYSYRLSLGDRKDKDKYYDDPKAWDESEKILREVLESRQCQFEEAPNEAAFYGPKIDVQMTNINGKEDTAFTVQYDFCMPNKFKLNYINQKGQEQRTIVIHRSSIGAVERIVAFLLEHFAGALPLWLSPLQVAILPVSDKFLDQAKALKKELLEKDQNIRVEVDGSDESLGKKIRNQESQKVPYMIILGQKELDSNLVSVRQRGEKDLGSMTLASFSDKIQKEIADKLIF
jgi:threonyl-tRNA synthetase